MAEAPAPRPPRPWGALLLVAAAYGAGFSLVWGGAHHLTLMHASRLPLWFDWEARVPFQAWALPLYFSMDWIVLFAPFFYRSWRPAAALMTTFFVQLCIAAPFFVLVPIEPGFTNHMPTGVWGTWLFDPLGLPNMSQFNHTPSLHVTYSLTLASALTMWRPAWTRWVWAIAVCATTLLVHEHHLLCIAGGLVLWLITNWTVRPWATRRFKCAV